MAVALRSLRLMTGFPTARGALDGRTARVHTRRTLHSAHGRGALVAHQSGEASPLNARYKSSVITREQQQTLRRIVDLVASSGIRKVQLPELVVCGDTSSGKSSLLTHITNVELPSASNICTRCPTRIRMEQSSTVKCSVHVTWDANQKAKLSAGGTAPEGADAGGLDERAALTEPCQVQLDELTGTIAKYQARLLELEGVSGGVSSSVIEVRISGPDQVDLTVIDLPGIVRLTGKGENASIGRQIDSLQDKYLKNELSINLAVMPANVDFHNSEITKRALQYDGETLRTLPIVTKADLVDQGAEEDVVRLVNGAATDTEFTLGFHIVKLRSQKDVDEGVTIEESKRNEQEFFERETLPYRHRIAPEHRGIDALCSKLSKVYIDHLRRHIPAVIRQLEVELEQTQQQLKRLGPALSTPAAVHSAWQKEKDRIEDVIKRLTLGAPAELEFNTPMTLRAALEKRKEEFRCAIDPEEFGEFKVGDTVLVAINGKLESCTVAATCSSSASATDGQCTKFAVFPDEERLIEYVSSDATAPPKAIDSATELSRGKLHATDTGQVFYTYHPNKKTVRWRELQLFSEDQLHCPCSDLLEEIRLHRTTAMPLFEGRDVFMRHVRRWIWTVVQPATSELLADVERMVRAYMEVHLVEYNHRKPKLKVALTAVSDRACEQWATQTDQFISQLLRHESREPQTLNNYFQSNILRLRLKPMRDQMMSQVIKASESNHGQDYIPVSVVQSIFDQADHRQSVEFVAEEVGIALKAYYKVARKSIVDTVAKAVDASLTSDDVADAMHDDSDFDADEDGRSSAQAPNSAQASTRDATMFTLVREQLVSLDAQDLLKPPPHVVAERQCVQDQKHRIQSTLNTINDDLGKLAETAD